MVGVVTAKDHKVKLQINSYGDNIGWAFSRYRGYTRDAAMARNKASLYQMQSSAFFRFGVVIPISKSHADRLHDILIGFLNTFE